MNLPPGMVIDFCQEAQSLLERADKCLRPLSTDLPAEAREALCRPIQRHLHTVKGNAGFIGAEPLQRALHRVEDFAEGLLHSTEVAAVLVGAMTTLRTEIGELALGRPPEDSSPGLERLERGESLVAGEGVGAHLADEDARVSREQLDDLLAATSDLSIRHAQALGRVPTRGPVREAVEALNPAVRRLQIIALALRVQTFATLFQRLKRVVQDEALRVGKPIDLVADGAQVEVDKAVLEVAANCLGHLVRNAVAHGIEPLVQRQAAGKTERGTIRLSVTQHAESVRVVVSDDGGGLNVEAIRARALERGLDPRRPAESLIFEAGFSTAQLDQLAGRGIGLDAVQAAARAAGGTVDVSSSPQRGCAFGLTLPASLALQRALVIELGGEAYALPAVSVFRTVRTRDVQIRRLGERRWVEHEGRLVPFVDTSAELGITARMATYAVLFEANGVGALEIDHLAGEHELVFRPLESQFLGASPVSGATLSASGALLLRLDPARLIATTQRHQLSQAEAVR